MRNCGTPGNTSAEGPGGHRWDRRGPVGTGGTGGTVGTGGTGWARVGGKTPTTGHTDGATATQHSPTKNHAVPLPE